LQKGQLGKSPRIRRKCGIPRKTEAGSFGHVEEECLRTLLQKIFKHL